MNETVTSHRRRAQLGVVVIGRNEGPLLLRCLAAIGERASAIVYADSASTDDSVALVEEAFPAVHVVRIDPSGPMGPARGRNEGARRLMAELPDVAYIQFVDGDCDLTPGWLELASAYLDGHPDVGILYGRLRERDRERNRYHRLADMEWEAPAGETRDGGGIMMVRRKLWEEVGGQNANIPAAEEREFITRAWERNWRVVRLAEPMCEHDIDMARFSQWWTRMVRMGHSWAQGLWIGRDRRHLKQVASLALWGAVIPAVATATALPTLGASLPAAGLAYRRLWRKIAADRRATGASESDARLYASAMVASKFAGTLGVVQFALRTLPAGRGGRR